MSFEGGRHGGDRGPVLGTAAIAPFLASARLKRPKIADQQRTDPWRPAELVRRHGNKVGFRKCDLPGSLRAVTQEQRSCVSHQFLDFPDRLQDARFIVDELDGHEGRPGGECGLEPGKVDTAFPLEDERDRFRAHCSDDDIMLGRIDETPRRLCTGRCNLHRFARARGQNDVMTPAELTGDAEARLLEGGARPTPVRVGRTWVGPGRHCGGESSLRLGEHRRRRRMVQVQSLRAAQNRRIPANCHTNARPYIGAHAAAHPRSGPYSRAYATFMPEVIFPGPEGRLEGRFHPGTRPRAPVALVLHSHPQAGGTMNNKIVQLLYQTFVKRGFATLRFNFRGVGKSQGVFDNGIGELSDAASALDWVQSIHPEAETTWVAGVSFGAWIGMQLLMRRPEIRGFISIAPPANMYDFSFLAPCPSSGIIIQGEADEVVTPSAVQKLVDKLRTQRHITIHHDLVPGANHFFANELDLLMKSVDDYLDMRLATDPVKPAIPSRSSRS